jgi:hypothetical protein
MSKLAEILADQPHEYYCVVSNKGNSNDLALPEFISEDGPLFATNPLRVYSSEKLASSACGGNEKPLYLICLACFLNILRSRIGINKMLLNGQYLCDVSSWRTPCQTTAILKNANDTYYIEGCRKSGVFWKPLTEKPEFPPAFLMCGAKGMDCIWDECPNGWEFFDTEPMTLCKVSTNIPIGKAIGQCIIRFITPESQFFYAGISDEGFDFANTLKKAVRLDETAVFRIAKAIANVQLNWSQGMMSGKPGCRIVVSNLKGQEIISIES